VHLFLNKDWSSAGYFALGAIPMPNGKGAGLVPASPRIFDAIPHARDTWSIFIKSDPRIHDIAGSLNFPDDLARVRRPWGHAKSYGVNGAVLLGDAIHPVSPAAGQGANMSVADAVCLAELFLKGDDDLVGEYERRRRPANERSMLYTRRAAQILSLPGFMFKPILPLAFRWLNRHPESVARFLRSASVAFQDEKDEQEGD
jgi:2-polyprenyl-6-methoxyphenol hydroxylase-like FAD-dependent oxidoreductase